MFRTLVLKNLSTFTFLILNKKRFLSYLFCSLLTYRKLILFSFVHNIIKELRISVCLIFFAKLVSICFVMIFVVDHVGVRSTFKLLLYVFMYWWKASLKSFRWIARTKTRTQRVNLSSRTLWNMNSKYYMKTAIIKVSYFIEKHEIILAYWSNLLLSVSV